MEDTDDLVSNAIACCCFVVYFAPQAQEVISVVIIGVAAFATMVTAVVEDLE